MQRVGQGTGTGLTLTGSLHHLFYIQDESCHNTWRERTLCGILPLLELGGKCVWLDVLGTGVIREGEQTGAQSTVAGGWALKDLAFKVLKN